jgi:hypothetical protein
MRTLFGIGTPRSLQGRMRALVAGVVGLWARLASSLLGVTRCRLGAISRPGSPRIIDLSCYP